MKFITHTFIVIVMLGSSCQSVKQTAASRVKLITLDPGHFHAALVQKSMYPGVDATVYVYAPPGPDVQLHLERVKAYNERSENPTTWKEELFTGPDFLEKMLQERKGNVV